MIFYTSELMLGDNEYLCKSNRHFTNILTMNSVIISSWNQMVSGSDDVYILGGVGDFEYLKSLNGNKRLIMSSYEMKHFNDQRRKKTGDPYDELDVEIYEKFLYNNYGIVSVNHTGRMIKKTCTGKFVWLTTNPSYTKSDMFNVYGCIGDFQKMVSNGINASVGVNNYYPISETELEYYSKHVDKLV